MPALVGLLVVVFSIAGLLVYEAWNTGESRRAIAERGLQDYAAYAAWSTARAGDGAIAAGLATLFRGLVGNRLNDRDSIAELTTLVAGARYLDNCDCAINLPADYYFRYDARSGSLTIAPPTASASGRAETGWAAAKVGSFTPSETAPLPRPDLKWLRSQLDAQSLQPSGGFVVRFVNNGDSTVAIGFAPQRNESDRIIGELGFVTSAPVFASRMITQLWRYPTLLPLAITRGLPSDSLIAASVSIPNGREIFRSKGWAPQLRSDTASLAMFTGGMKVRVALRPDATARLEGGVVPGSRIPVWVGLLLLTGLLTAIIVRNLQREHELARLRLEFSASVSHELRTPLAQILLFGETLTLGRTRSDSEKSNAASVIVREARRLMHLVDNTLAFSRAERPVVSLSPERLQLAPVVADVIEMFAPLASARNVVIRQSLDETATAFVDPEAFRQILINLLDNAVKYGPVGQTVNVGLSSGHSTMVMRPAILAPEQPVRRETIRLTVDDEGPGVTGRARDEIWVPFVRGRNGETPTGTGCGLGLSVVRDLAERHNAKSWVDSSPTGSGSRFVVEFPAVANQPQLLDQNGDTETLESESQRMALR
ncbi:MAG: HAMP domain-containing sensor histidine kinase [Gemmatimonadales bacterium]